MIAAAGFFFITALIYASVGFGGGSTYNAILMLMDTDYRIIPLLALSCNIIVVAGGLFHFHRNGYLTPKRLLPWMVFSIPSSFVGGLIPIPEHAFTLLLGLALMASGLKLLWPEQENSTSLQPPVRMFNHSPAILGTGLGLAAGLTGIGGGIFLAPVLHFIKWGNAKQIAAGCALFILVNSLAGMAGQIIKMNDTGTLAMAVPYWFLFPAVMIGGQIGSHLGAGRMNMNLVKKITGILILYVSARLLLKFAAFL